MKNQDPRNCLAKSLDSLIDSLGKALGDIDTKLACMNDHQLYDALCFVREYGNLADKPHALLLEKLEYANASASAHCGAKLDIHLSRPDPACRRNWQLCMMNGRVTVLVKDFPTFDEGMAAFDTLSEFLRLARREGQFTFEAPRPSKLFADDPDLPF